MLNLQEHIDLTHLNTLQLKSTAAHYVAINQVEDLSLLSPLLAQYTNFFVLGGGSNILMPPYYQGLVIHNRLSGIKIVPRGSLRLVTAMAGELWDAFVGYCTHNGAYGLENLSLIPGTVGASPIQNIGAYGVEVKDFIDEVQVYDLLTEQFIVLSNNECQFRYRNSLLKNNARYIVVSVTFKLSAQPVLNLNYGELAQRLSSHRHPTPEDVRQAVIAIRQAKLPDPQALGNVGSFFHNPIVLEQKAQLLQQEYPSLPQFNSSEPGHIKLSAGWLIDNLGLKGIQRGNVGVYEKQALVLVNYGDACQAELLDFAAWIQMQVHDKYDIELNIEPIIISP